MSYELLQGDARNLSLGETMRQCTICDSKHYAKDLCYRHYMQRLRTGTTSNITGPPTLKERFDSKAQPQPSGCWRWDGVHFATGYPQISVKGKTTLAHRVAWELYRSPPVPALLHHTCHNKGCVKPKHLQPLDRQQHAASHSGHNSGNTLKTHCPRGHPYNYTTPDGRSRRCLICDKRLKHERRNRAK